MSIIIMLAGALWVGQGAEPLHCRISLAAGAKSARCEVTAPTGRAVRHCSDADRQAKHCTKDGGTQYVAWVVHSGPGHCRITDKKTNWKSSVVSAKVSKTNGTAATCDLFVEVQ